MRNTISIPLALMLAAAGPAIAQVDVTFTRVATIDISEITVSGGGAYIGTNPYSIAWDGTNLYVAGYLGSGVGDTTEIAILQDVLDDTANLTVSGVDGSSAFTPPLRGRPGLDWDDGLGLLATHDLGTDSSPDQIQIFSGQPLVLEQSSEAGSGIAGPSWDYGFEGAGFTRSADAFGESGPVAGVMDYRSQNVVSAFGRLGPIGFDPFDLDLAPIYTAQTGGPDISGGTADTVWRDVDFNPDGGIAARVTQDLVIAERNDQNGLAGDLVKVPDQTNPQLINALVPGNNVAWVYDVPCLAGDIIIWNDRGPGCIGTMLDAIKLSDRLGNDVTYEILDDADAVITDWPNGNCIYDYAWDPDSQQLFVMEYTSRKVYVLEPVCGEQPEPCFADTNGDGVLDNSDIAAFIALFLVPDLAADTNGDGVLDNSDIASFITLFLAGCP